MAKAVAAIVALYLLYLGWRVADERRDVAARVDAILGEADPDELSLPRSRINIILRVEDPTFRTNMGIDVSTPGAGLTTLSQSLGKSLFFDDFEPGFAKLELIALTRFALYPAVAKDQLFKAWLATAYLGTRDGRPVNGFAAGARAWFGKPLRALSDREFVSLVAMLPAPDRYTPTADAAANADRVARIERLLAGRCRPTGLRDVELAGCG